MSKDRYNDVEELCADLLNDIKNSVADEVVKEMKKIELLEKNKSCPKKFRNGRSLFDSRESADKPHIRVKETKM